MDYKSTRGYWICFIVIATIFFCGSLILSIAGNGSLFVSPDETANAYFAQQFSETGSLRAIDSVTRWIGNGHDLFPRSVVAKNGMLLPQSFLGLPVLYGIAVYFFGSGILFILTPLLAIVAALAFRQLMTRFFSSHVGDLSAMLFLVHPALWYYSARGLMHNVLFVCLLVFAACHFFCRPLAQHLKRCEKRFGRLLPFQKSIDLFFAGLLIGLALFVRTSEIMWIGLTILFLFLTSIRSLRWKEFALFFFSILIGFLPFFFFNQRTYGHPLVTGYTVSDSVGVVQSAIATSSTSKLLFPFGLDFSAVARHVAGYGILLFWWLSILACFGFSRCVWKQKKYALVFLMITLWLGFWYGSWTFFDNPDHTQVTIANSYVRYWLPVFILSIPFVAESIMWVSARTRSRFVSRFALGTLMLLVMGLNVRVVFFDGQDALVQVADILHQSVIVKADVLARTEPNAVIVVDRADKLFFPQRRVRYPLRSEQTYALLPQISQVFPLYYYGITLPQKDLEYLNTSKLKTLGLQIEFLKTYTEESLYRIHP